MLIDGLVRGLVEVLLRKVTGNNYRYVSRKAAGGRGQATSMAEQKDDVEARLEELLFAQGAPGSEAAAESDGESAAPGEPRHAS